MLKMLKVNTDKGQRTDNRHKQTCSKAPGEATKEDFQDGCRNKMLLEILNLHIFPKASHQVWAQSDLPFGSGWGLKIFKIAPMAAILDILTEGF